MKSVQEVSKQFPKTDVRYWKPRVKKLTYTRDGERHETHDYSVKIAFKGRRETFPLGTPNKDAAAGKARDVYLSLFGAGWEETLKQFKPRCEVQQVNAPTVGDLFRCYRRYATARATTILEYEKALRRIVAGIFKIDDAQKFHSKTGGSQHWRDSVDRTPLHKLTPDLIQRWCVGYVKQAKTPEEQRAARSTVSSLVRNARSFFAKKVLRQIRNELELPDVLPFEGVVSHSARVPRYHSRIDTEEIMRKAMGYFASPRREDESAKDFWKRQQQWKVILLALFCGLRRSEIDTLLWSAFDFATGTLHVDHNEFKTLKSDDSAGVVDLDTEFVEIFRELKDAAESRFVVEATAPPRSLDKKRFYRAEPHFNAVLQWLRAHGVAADKPLHELRKEMGSLVCQLHGIYAASRALRHSKVGVTADFYLDKKSKATPGLGSLLRSDQ